jgi:hypothetical protein
MDTAVPISEESVPFPLLPPPPPTVAVYTLFTESVAVDVKYPPAPPPPPAPPVPPPPPATTKYVTE